MPSSCTAIVRQTGTGVKEAFGAPKTGASLTPAPACRRQPGAKRRQGPRPRWKRLKLDQREQSLHKSVDAPHVFNRSDVVNQSAINAYN